MSDRELCTKQNFIVNHRGFVDGYAYQYNKASQQLISEEISRRGITSCDIATVVCTRELKLKPGTNEYSQCYLNVQKQETARAAEAERMKDQKQQTYIEMQRLLNEANKPIETTTQMPKRTDCHVFGNNMTCTEY